MSETDTDDVTVARYRKNAVETIVVKRKRFNGHDLAELRVWLATPGGEMPTKKGIVFSMALAPQLLSTELVEALGAGRPLLKVVEN
jgi:hypothetical protein